MVSALAVMPDSLLASGSSDSTIRLWNTASCTTVCTLDCPRIVMDLVVLSDGHLAAYTHMNTVRVWRTDTYERVPHLDFALNGVFGRPSASDTLATWVQRLNEVAEQSQGHPIKAFAGLPDGRNVQLLDDKTVKVGKETLISMPLITSVIVGCTGDVVVADLSSVRMVREVPSRANVFLALTAVGLPPPYILKIMS